MSDYTGPNLGNLRNLRDMLPTMAKGIKSQQIGGKGRPVNMADKACKICGLCWGNAPAETPVTHTFCDGCVAKINTGLTAVVCGSRYAFVSMPEQKLDNGKVANVLNVTPEFFDKMIETQKAKSQGGSKDGHRQTQ